MVKVRASESPSNRCQKKSGSEGGEKVGLFRDNIILPEKSRKKTKIQIK